MSEHPSMRTRNVLRRDLDDCSLRHLLLRMHDHLRHAGRGWRDGIGGDTTSGGTTGSGGGSTGSGGATVSGTEDCSQMKAPPAAPAAGTTKAPCDIYADDGGPCVAAHSTVRALYATYDGPLYQVKKADGTTKDIGVLAAGWLRKLGRSGLVLRRRRLHHLDHL